LKLIVQRLNGFEYTKSASSDSSDLLLTPKMMELEIHNFEVANQMVENENSNRNIISIDDQKEEEIDLTTLGFHNKILYCNHRGTFRETLCSIKYPCRFKSCSGRKPCKGKYARSDCIHKCSVERKN
jgi:hypothetical protein